MEGRPGLKGKWAGRAAAEARSCFQGSSAPSSHQVALGNGRPVPAVLLANKCDQRAQGLCPKLPKLEAFCRDSGFIGWYETSAKARARVSAPLESSS